MNKNQEHLIFLLLLCTFFYYEKGKNTAQRKNLSCLWKGCSN